jgi:hypothetical protein
VCADDLRDLRASGLTNETVRENGLWTARECCLKPGGPWYDAMVFPYRDLDGRPTDFARIRPHRPPRGKDGKPVKYLQAPGSGQHAYFPAASLALLRDGASDVYATEGEKKALALSQLGLAAVGLGGVFGGLKKGTDELIDDLAAVPLAGRAVRIVFDHDPKPPTRRHVALAAQRLAGALRRAGAREVYGVELPPGPDGGKQGVDDFLVANGAEAFRELVRQARPITADPLFANFAAKEVADDAGKAKTVRVGKTPTEIRQSLTRVVGDWPKRVGKLLFVAEDYEASWLEQTDDLFAWVRAQLEEPVQWFGGPDKVTKAEFHAHLQQAAEAYEAVELLPHEPPMPGHFYLHPLPGGGDGKALEALVGRFSPATDADRGLIHAAFLTPFWGGRPGSRPAFLIESEDDDGQGGRGTGKTTLAEMVAELAGGHFDARPSEDIDKIMTRLLWPAGLGRRVGLLDNVKTLRFSWSDLEGLITTNTISGRQLYVGEGRRPNTLTWFITLNNANLSKDMAQRCVIIRVRRPTYDASW